MNITNWKIRECAIIVACMIGWTVQPNHAVAQIPRVEAWQFGLPRFNQRKSEPFVMRVFKVNEQGIRLKPQPDSYPKTVRDDYVKQPDEVVRTHEGADFQSRPAPDKPPIPLEFKSGVSGQVVSAGTGEFGLIGVQIGNGNVLEFLHTSVTYVKMGDLVTPDTVLGLTGKKGADAIHLHVQAKDANRRPISPDLVFQSGQRLLGTPTGPPVAWDEFDPDEGQAFEVISDENNRINAKQLPRTKWVVEVIGYAGRVDETLGEFWSYSSASQCALDWSVSRPNDLRLTREREVQCEPSF